MAGAVHKLPAGQRKGTVPWGTTAILRIWSGHSREISALTLVVLALIAVAPRLTGPVRWWPDSLFYQAQVYELQGESQAAAIHRVFSSRTAAGVAQQPNEASRVGNPAWVKYSAQFYRRRWLVSAIAAALSPIAGDRSLLDTSILGYIAVGLLLFALLRRRFSDATSLLAAAVCLWLPPLHMWAAQPLTDSWGLALEVGALLAALLALERGAGWIAVWTASMLVLSFTRDSTIVLLVAVGLTAITTRTRRGAAVLVTGIAASIPALALFGAPLVRQLAYILNGFRIPSGLGASYVVAHYPAAILSVLRADAAYPAHLGVSILVTYSAAAVLVAAVGYMAVAAPRRDPFFALSLGVILGAALTIAVAGNYTRMRLELVGVPCVAVALAFALERLRVGRPAVAGGRSLPRVG